MLDILEFLPLSVSVENIIEHEGRFSVSGRLTLTNYSLYFEASSVITYENAVEIELSKDTLHIVRAAHTGPWGAPLFDKAIVYESPAM